MRIEVLDHGSVELIEAWGSDERIIESARMSTNKGFLGWERKTYWVCPECHYTLVNDLDPKGGDLIECPNQRHTGAVVFLQIDKKQSHAGDEKLLAYLWNNKHSTPFEMAGMTIEVQAPIMVFREWHRHRTQAYSELSARYTPLPDVNYVPSIERLLINAGKSNKQAGVIDDADELTVEAAELFQEKLRETYLQTQARYETALLLGVPKELARLHIPVGRYSRMRASANLRNWLGFLALRCEPHAQYEIRQYANALVEIMAHKFPRTLSLFKGSMNFAVGAE